MTNFAIDERFRGQVHRHLIGNLLAESTQSPLILGIFGPPGEGKTFQAQLAAEELGVEVRPIASSELESENAAHPVQLLRREYIAASARVDAGHPTVLVIDDIDTAIGDWGAMVQYTVNRQLVVSQLMAFCDFPNEVAGQRTRRVPVIVTGNRPEILYGPLRRPGRMRFFDWKPSAQTRAALVVPLFENLPADDVSQLVADFPHRSVAFWSDVSALIWEDQLEDWISKQSRPSLIEQLKGEYSMRLRGAALSIADLRAAAERLDGSARNDDALIYGGN
ncbi:MAG TPA: AAA family ATPase [Rhodoglobus sp.]|jgi:hypothetical protein|nr:AAA family ATPase [Rhodoglobus sp.]